MDNFYWGSILYILFICIIWIRNGDDDEPPTYTDDTWPIFGGGNPMDSRYM